MNKETFPIPYFFPSTRTSSNCLSHRSMLPSSWMPRLDSSLKITEFSGVSDLPSNLTTTSCAWPTRSSSFKITSLANLSLAFLQHQWCLSHHFAIVSCCERFLPPLLSYQVFFISSFTKFFAFCCQLEASPVSRMRLVLHFENLPCTSSVVAQNCLQQGHSTQ